MLKDIFFQPWLCKHNRWALHIAGGRTAEEVWSNMMSEGFSAILADETRNNYVYLSKSCWECYKPNSAFTHAPHDPTGYGKQVWRVNESKF